MRNDLYQQSVLFGLLDSGAVEAAQGNVTAQGLTVAQECVDVETAKQTGRVAFGDMVAF